MYLNIHVYIILNYIEYIIGTFCEVIFSIMYICYIIFKKFQNKSANSLSS